jgi:hypothetical protein
MVETFLTAGERGHRSSRRRLNHGDCFAVPALRLEQPQAPRHTFARSAQKSALSKSPKLVLVLVQLLKT